MGVLGGRTLKVLGPILFPGPACFRRNATKKNLPSSLQQMLVVSLAHGWIAGCAGSASDHHRKEDLCEHETQLLLDRRRSTRIATRCGPDTQLPYLPSSKQDSTS